jgi:hypothetical protein
MSERQSRRARATGVARRTIAIGALHQSALRALWRAARTVRSASPDALIRALTRASTAPETGERDAAHAVEIAAIGDAVQRLGRAFGRRRCLIEALAARELLAGRGIPCTLRFSVSRDHGTLLAHAFVEANGVVVVGDGPGVGAPLSRPRARSAPSEGATPA